MATNPIPKGTKNLSINIPATLHTALRKKAKASGLSMSAYVRRILELAHEKNLRLEVSYRLVDESESDVLMVAEPEAKPTKRKRKGS